MSEVLSWRFAARHSLLYQSWLVLLCISLSLCASASLAPLSNYFQESWTTRDGLPHNTINSISQSEDGYLWVATWEGIARFNGREFSIFGRGELTGLPDSGVRVLNKDHAGNLLIAGSRGGFSLRSPNSWRSWAPFNVLLNAVVQDQHGAFWLASEGQGLFRQAADGSRTRYTQADGLPSDVIHSLLVDSNGLLWIGSGRGLSWLDTAATQPDITVIKEMPAAPVFVLAIYKENILAGTEQGLFSWFNGEAVLLDAKLADLPVSSLLINDNQLWIGTTDRGLLRYSELGLEQLTIAGGLPNNRILSLYFDREQSIWVGTNGGLFRLRDAPFVTYTAELGLAGDYVRSVMAHSDGSVWIGSSQGVNRLAGQQLQTLDLSAASRGQSVLSLAEATDGSVWIGTYTDGVLLWQDGKITRRFDRQNGLLANEVRALLPAKDGGLWVGTAQGLNYVGADGIKNFTTTEGLPAPFIMALYQHSDGRLFIGTGAGVAIMQPDGSITPVDFSNLDGAEYAFGFAFDIDADAIWMTTDRGLVHYALNSGELKMLGRNVGLPFDKLFQVVIDRQQHLWISSNRGILRLEREHIAAVLSGKHDHLDYELFGEGDGMQSAQANGGSMPAATLAQDGAVWFATSKGASMVQPLVLKRFAANIPPIVIESLKVNGIERQLTSSIQLAAGVNRLEFAFAGLGFVMPQRIQYRTKLQGFDSDWVERGSQNIAEYTNLPPGEYRFLVSAAYPQGGWSEAEASLSFTIFPYIWQRLGFWLAIVGLITLFGLIMLRWRLNALRRREQLLRWQVAEKTVELQQQADHLQAVDQERSALLVQLKRQAEEFEQQARSDALTGLANRRAFDEALARECARSRRNNLPLCLVLLDIDHFKQVNDSYSHSIGDEILKLVAAEISNHCRADDTVARWGGEEFAILLPNTTVKVAQDICERMRQAIMQIDCAVFAAKLRITVSMGIAEFAGEAHYDKLLSRSDSALYKAKQNGRNRVDIAV
ncbi:diguanylate cyclase (GGDEF)-like protein [Rheinheimera pacifica]|uniref:diguanylate cyclase n=1 Tax=Rheinheimera pacifica TaxID=173990 RepID=UPI0021685E8E|nr:diguanylate cyclase [Rheinheimera pacifica]MCS4305971.1 diguanylate cyclase (GGDEF)-like protein [Rheinheimera pacifica]